MAENTTTGEDARHQLTMNAVEQVRGMTDDERQETLTKLLVPARERHITYGSTLNASLDGLVPFVLDVERVDLGLWGVGIETPGGGSLLVRRYEAGAADAGGIYRLEVTAEAVEDAIRSAGGEAYDGEITDNGVAIAFEDGSGTGIMDGAPEDAEEISYPNIQINAQIVPVIVEPAETNAMEGVQARQLTMLDLITWLAIADAFAAGDEAQADLIFALAYVQFDKTPSRYMRTKDVTRVIDISPAVNAVFNPTNPHRLQLPDYFSGTGVTVPVGDAGTLAVGVQAPADADITTFSPTDTLAEHERYWLDMVNTRALQGESVVHGSDLLKAAGCRNPYARTMASTMAEAAADILKLTRYGTFIDVTRERIPESRSRRRLISSMQYRPIIDAEFFINRYEDGSDEVRDFEIRLRNQDEPIKSLPFFEYSTTTGRYIEAGDFPACFKGMHLQQDHRYMWHYVERQLKTKGLAHGNTVLFSTMFEALQMDGRDRNAQKKRQRMLDMLEKMLRRAAGGHRVGGGLEYEPIIKAWRYKTEGGRRVGIIVTPLEDGEKGVGTGSPNQLPGTNH